MRIAVVGAGVAGLTAAWVLARRHDVVLFEAGGGAGGHANTLRIDESGRAVDIDTGFIVFNELNYPNLCRLFSLLGVESRQSDMSFSVHCESTRTEYNGTSLDKLFGQRRNLARPAFWRMVREILRFNRKALADLDDGLPDDITVDGYATREGYARVFVDHYLVPLGASLWSCDAETFRSFPMRFVIEFLHNHRMLQVEGRPVWRTVSGGSGTYVRKMLAGYKGRLHLNTPVQSVTRGKAGVGLWLNDGRRDDFDEVVLATHADQSLGMVRNPRGREREALAMFPYRKNRVTLHTDTRVLPDRRNIWAAWNYRIPATGTGQPSVTYNMNMLQKLSCRETYCISLNGDAPIDEERVLRRIEYEHPVFIPGRDAAQREHHELVRREGISYCGAYWGYGFHEDGIRSALNVCAAFDMGLEQ